MLTRVAYNAGTWPALRKCEFLKFHKALMRTYRVALSQDIPRNSSDIPWLSDQQILESLELPSPRCLLLLQRMQLMYRLCRHRPREVLQLLHYCVGTKSSWLDAFVSDVRLLALNVSTLQDLHGTAFADIISGWFAKPHAWQKSVKAALADPILRKQETWEIPTTLALGGCFECSNCNMCFNSLQALRVHQFRKHARLREVRTLITTHYCCCC